MLEAPHVVEHQETGAVGEQVADPSAAGGH
jgi:hypothetical protein